jgi:hypothetical protein
LCVAALMYNCEQFKIHEKYIVATEYTEWWRYYEMGYQLITDDE